MLRKIVLSALIITFCIPAVAQNVSEKKVIKRLKKDIEYLASDELQGRRTGSEGERKAAEYIVEYYANHGIKPYNGNYLYPFKFIAGRSIDEHTLLKVDNRPIKIPEHGFPLSFSGNADVHDDVIPGVMEQGKIWMMPLFDDEEQANDPHFNWEKQAYEKAEDAARNGARGVLFYDEYNAKYPAIFNKKTEYKPLSIPVAYLTYKGYVKFANPEIQEAIPNLHVWLDVLLKDKVLNGNNILGYVDNNAQYTVVIGAHYDHLGLGEDGNSLSADSKGQIHNGADDNASGSAALMQLADWIEETKLNNYNYLFIHFSAEELGLIGSKKIVEELGLSGDKIAYMINMDMIGRLNDSTHALTVGGIGTSPTWGNVVDVNSPDFKIVIDSSGVGPSDHSSFYHKEIPVLFFFTGTHSDYHKPSDDADKVNYEGEALIMHYIYDIIAKMELQPKPEFTKTKQKEMGRVRFKVTLGIMPDYAYQEGGVRIDGVTDGRTADVAGLKAGDIVIKLGDVEILGMQSYMEALGAFDEGETTEVTFMRDGEKMTMPLKFLPKK